MNEIELPEFNPHNPEDLKRAILQLFIIGTPSYELSEDVNSELKKGLGGVIFFRKNVQDVDQVVALCESAHAAARELPLAPFVSLDQEGGRVVRVQDPLTPLPTMRSVGDKNDLHLAADVAEVIATEVCALGFNLNYSPVIDVDTNPDNPVIGDRAFSRDPETVARFGGAFVAGHLASGVIPCGKHFPGHGDTDTDSHLTLPTISHDRARLDQIELHPFKKLAEAGIPMIMTAHVVVPAIDPEEPATLSPLSLTGILRDEMKYEGIIATDDLEMAAVAERYEIEKLVLKSLHAGADLFLICHTFEKYQRAVDYLFSAAQENADIKSKIFTAANRIAKTKKSLLRSWPKPWKKIDMLFDMIGSESHLATVDKIKNGGFEGKDPTART